MTSHPIPSSCKPYGWVVKDGFYRDRDRAAQRAYVLASAAGELHEVVPVYAASAASPSQAQIDNWWCPTCQGEVPPERVTYEETHDPRAGGCGSRVLERAAGIQSPPAPSQAQSDDVPQRELDALLDHIYEHGTAAEGVRRLASKLCQAYATGIPGGEVADASHALDLLETLFAAYEDGVDVYEDPDEQAGYLGHAVKLDDETFRACADLLNRERPRPASSSVLEAQPQPPRHRCSAHPFHQPDCADCVAQDTGEDDAAVSAQPQPTDQGEKK